MSTDYSWLQGTAYEDDQGNVYKVLPGRDDIGFRARFCRPHKAGWLSVPGLPWRPTVAEAQRELDELAARKGWKVHA
jgi:hypothetical protein